MEALSDDEDRFEELSDSSSLASTAPRPRSPQPSPSAPLPIVEVHHDDAEEDDARDDFHDTFDEPLAIQIAQAESLKEAGNEEFKKSRWQQALDRYREGLAALPVLAKRKGKAKAESQDEEAQLKEEEGDGDDRKVDDNEDATQGDQEETEEVKKMRTLRSVLHANVAACLLKMSTWKEAVEYCSLSLQDDPFYAKARHRRAQANEEIGSWGSLQSSLEDYDLLAKSSAVPSSMDPIIASARRRLPDKIKVQAEKEKAEMMGKLKEMGNSFLGMFGMSTDNFKMTQNENGGYSMSFQR